jgi:protein-S-isoprenylcysteine O-methyltransferase Ste14
MYVAWTAVLHVGAALATGSAWVVTTVPAAAGLVHREILREERELSEALGEEFWRYRVAVPRYLPARRRHGL